MYKQSTTEGQVFILQQSKSISPHQVPEKPILESQHVSGNVQQFLSVSSRI